MSSKDTKYYGDLFTMISYALGLEESLLDFLDNHCQKLLTTLLDSSTSDNKVFVIKDMPDMVGLRVIFINGTLWHAIPNNAKGSLDLVPVGSTMLPYERKMFDVNRYFLMSLLDEYASGQIFRNPQFHEDMLDMPLTLRLHLGNKLASYILVNEEKEKIYSTERALREIENL